MSLELPQKPNLEHLKNQAKDLLRRARTGDAEALTRFHSPNQLQLADALHAVANDYGFATWPKLKEYVESLAQPWGPPELFTAAIRAQDASEVEKLLRDHPELRAHLDEPAANYGEGLTPLLAAVQYSHRPIIGALLQAGAGINARSHFWAGGVGVLDECAPDLAPFLIERGAALDAHSAARLGLLDQLRDFEKSEPALQNTHGARGQTPLHFASTIEIAQLLLDHGAEIDAIELLHESTPAQHMLRVVQARYFPRDRQDVARFLIARGCRTDIYMAAALGDLAMAQSQVETNPACLRLRTNESDFPKHDPRSQGSIYLELFGHNRTPQMVARDFGHEDVFRFLLDHSPEDVKLSQAFELGDESLFREFLARRPNLKATLSEAMHRQLPNAAQNNNSGALRLMLEAGWPVDTKGEYNLTALAWASWHGNADAVRIILRHGPELERSDSDHHITALGCALHGSMNSWHRDTGDYAATVEALLEAGAKPPKVTEALEASDEVKEVLRRHAN